MNDATQQQYDIIIVGAGIVGTALACKLAQDNPTLKIVVVEAATFKPNYTATEFDARVVALTIASQQLLQDIGAWPSIISNRFCPYTHMHVWDGTGTGSIDFDCREVGESALGSIVENSVIVEALLQQLKLQQLDNTNVKLMCPAKVSAINLPSANELALVILKDGTSLRAKLIIATDGAQSPIRHMAHLETREWEYGHTAIISTVQTEKSHQYTARQCFTEHGPLAFLPLETNEGNTNVCSIVWSAETAFAQQLLALNEADFSDALGRAFEHRLGAIKHITQRYSFPLMQRHCKHYFKPGVVVAGDAAHTIHPLAGQGVNLGLQDVVALADEIHRAMERNFSLADISILERYQRRRKGPNLAMMGVMEGFKQLFAQDSLPLRWLRNMGMRQLDKTHLIKSKVIKEAMGL